MQPPLASDPALATVLAAVQASLRDVERVFDAQLASDLPPVTQLVRHIERYHYSACRAGCKCFSYRTNHERGEQWYGNGQYQWRKFPLFHTLEHRFHTADNQ